MKFKFGNKVKVLNNEFYSETTFLVIAWSKSQYNDDLILYQLFDPILEKRLDCVPETDIEEIPRKPRMGPRR